MKKLLSMFLAITMLMTLLPMSALAASLGPDETHIVAGDYELCGSIWDPSDLDNLMTYSEEDGCYYKIYEDVSAGTYSFKVTTDKLWDKGDYNLNGSANHGGSNATAVVTEDGSTVIIGFDGEKATLKIVSPSDEEDDSTSPVNIGDTYADEYADLTALATTYPTAIEVSQNDDHITIKLLSDVTGRIEFAIPDGNFILDANGKTFSGGEQNEAISLVNNKGCTLFVVGSGTFTSGKNNTFFVGSDGSLFVESATISGKINTRYGLKAQAVCVDGKPCFSMKINEGEPVVYTSAQDLTCGEDDTIVITPLDAIPHPHPICGKVCECDDEHSSIDFIAWEVADRLPSESGNYYLTQDVTLSGDRDLDDTDINLCLNGHTITNTNNGIICQLHDNVTFNICDCGTDGKMVISGNAINFTGNNNEVNLYGGTLVSNTSNPVIDKESTGNVFNMYGGCIKSEHDSPAIAARYSVVNLYGGEIYTPEDNSIRVRENGKLNLCGDVAISHGEDFDHIICHYTSVIDATGYTGGNLTIYYESENISVGDIIVTNVTDETADKFTLSAKNAGYELKRDGNNLVVDEISNEEEEFSYYLVGWINNTDCYDETYKFVDGKLELECTSDSYVYVMDSNENYYWTDGWLDFNPVDAVLGKYNNNDKMHLGSGTYTLCLTVNGDGTLTLSTVEPAPTYTVTFDANGGTVSPMSAVTDKDGKLAELPTPERSGSYTFNGWFTAASGGEAVTLDTAYTEDTTIYAQWNYTGGSNGGSVGGSSVTRYTVKFETNGGSAIANASVTKNSKLAVPATPVKDGFKFDGWYTDASLTTAYDFDAKVVSGFTLYAKWIEVEKAPEAGSSFADVSKNDWFYENVMYVAENNLMNGVSSDNFAPNATLTRAMLVTVLYRAEGAPVVNKSIPFADVDAGAYYADAVIWAQQNGIVKGISETAFAPDAIITREQIAAIMFRYANHKNYNVSAGEDTNILSYADYDSISEYAIEAIQYATGSGLMNGKTNSTFNPKDNATRAEIAAILYRFLVNNK